MSALSNLAQRFSQNIRAIPELFSASAEAGQARRQAQQVKQKLQEKTRTQFEYNPPSALAALASRAVMPVETQVLRKDILLPTPEEKQQAGDRLRSTLKEFAQSFPREGAGAVLEVLERSKGLEPGTMAFTPQGGVEKFLFGEKPVETLSKQGEEILKGFGIPEKQSQQFGLLAGVAILRLDLLPPGGKDALKLLLAKANKAEDVVALLRGFKGIDNAKITDDVVQAIAKTKDEKVIARLVEGLKTEVVAIPKGLEALAAEARKYKSADEFVKAKENVFHGSMDKNWRMKDEALFLADDFDSANTYAGGGYEWRGVKPAGKTTGFYAKEGKTLDLNKTENVKKVFQEIKGSPELKKTFNSIPENYQYLDDDGYIRQLSPRQSASDFDDWLTLEYQSKPKIGRDGLKVRTGSYSFDEPSKEIRRKLYDAFQTYGQPTRQSVYNNWKDIIRWAKEKGYDYIDHVTESPDMSITFPEKVALNPKKTLLTKSQLTDIWNKAVGGVSKAPDIAETALPTTKTITEPTPVLPRAEAVQQPVGRVEGYTAKELSSDTLYQKTGVASRAVKEAETLIKDIPENPTKWVRFKGALDRFSTSFKEKVVNDWQRVKEATEKPGIKLTGDLTPYERRKLMAGRQTARLQKAEDFIRTTDKDVLDTSKKLKIKDTELQGEVFDYLKARHAPERNLALGEKAAGITTKEAAEITARLLKSPHATEIKRIADELQKFHNETLDILYAKGQPYGVINKELYDTLKSKYKNHIPLNRVMETDDIGEVLSGRGLAVRGTGLKRAVGSEREVRDIMENIYAARTQAIQRIEKNIVDNETYNFVQDYIKSFPEQELFEIVKPQAIGKTFEGRIITKQINDPTILQFQLNGKPAYIKINDTRLAVALRGVNREQLPSFMRYVASLTRFMSALVTRYSPEFVLSNKIRDMQEAMVYMASQKEVGFKGALKTFGRDPASLNDVKNFIVGKDTKGVRLYKQMIEDGGTTGGMALSTKKQIVDTLDSIRKDARSNPRKAFKTFAESVDKWNIMFEDSTRLSAYKEALASGLSREKAAIIAKNVSIDFNEFGTWGPIINSLYMFSNASIQGSAKMIRAMKKPKVASAVVGTVGASVFAASAWNDSVDPEWRNKVSKWDRLNGLNIVIPGTDEFYYISLPVSWGLKPIKVAMEYGNDLLNDKDVSVENATEGIFTAVLEGYNPVGGTDLPSALTPSPIEPFIDLARNRSWTGSKIRPDWNKYAPASTQYFKDLKDSKTGELLINVSQEVADKTGGRIEFSPADAEYILQQITGGPGKFTSKVFNTISAVGKGETPEVRDVPFLSRIFRKTPEERFYSSMAEQGLTKTLTEQERKRFYEKQEAEMTFEELKKMPKEQRKETYIRLKKENPKLIDRVDELADQEAKGLTRLERQILQLGVENGERARYLYKVFKEAKPEEKKELFISYKQKGILSDRVLKDLNFLFANPRPSN